MDSCSPVPAARSNNVNHAFVCNTYMAETHHNRVMKQTSIIRSVAALILTLAVASSSAIAQRIDPNNPPATILHYILQLNPDGFALMQGQITLGQRTVVIWDRSGNADDNVYKIVRTSPEGKKKVLYDGRPNEYDNIVAVVTFKANYKYEVRVKNRVTGEGTRYRIEVPTE